MMNNVSMSGREFGIAFLTLLLLSPSPALAQSLDLGQITQEFEMKFELPVFSDSGNVTVEPRLYVVYGSDMDWVERGILDSLRSGAFNMEPQVQTESEADVNVEVKDLSIFYLDDSEESFKIMEGEPGIVLLLGDTEHNNLTEYFVSNSSEIESKEITYGQLNVSMGEADGSSFVVIAHPRSRNVLVHEAAKTSPLRKYIPEEYVPIAAAGSGLSLMWLVNIFQTVFEFKALKFGRSKRRVRQKQHVLGPIKVEETLAVLGASFILGLSITFTFFGFTEVFFRKLALNWVLCLFAAISHEVSHRVVGKLFNIHIEYHFWWTGSAITLVTGYLGHPFSIQGFLMEKVEGPISKWKYGLTKLAAPVFSFIIMVGFAYLNYKDPREVYQIIFTTAGLWATAEILPFQHLDGKDIKNWSRLVWLICFAVIFGAFIIVNFLV